MLLFKTIKLPVHIKLKNKKARKKSRVYPRKRKDNKRLKLAVTAVFIGIIIFKCRNILFDDVSEQRNIQQSSVFSIENGAYVDEELIDEDKLESAFERIKFKRDKTPEILIFHTHSNESYAMGEDGTSHTVVDVGTRLAEIISENYGIGVVHDVTEYAKDENGNISTDGSYERSEAGVRKLLNKYPDVKVLIDIHRDSYNGEEINTVNIGSKSCARLMLVNGVCAVNDNGVKASAGVENPYIAQNIAYSYRLKKYMDNNTYGIMKNIYLKPYRYSLLVKPCSFLLEAGNENNTFEETENSLYSFADALINSLEER